MNTTEIYRAAAAFIASGMFEETRMIERDTFMPNVRGMAIEFAMRLRDDVEEAVERRYRPKIIVTDPDGEDGDWNPSIRVPTLSTQTKGVWCAVTLAADNRFMMVHRGDAHPNTSAKKHCAMRCTD